MPFVGNVGSAIVSNKDTNVITVGAAGVAAGNTIFYRFGGQAVPTSVTDSKGNTYTLIASGAVRNASLYRCDVGTALVSGDTITASFAMMENSQSSAEEFSDIEATVDQAAQSATGASTTPSVAMASLANATDLLFGHLSLDASSGIAVTEDADSAGGDTWHTLTEVVKTGQINGAYKFTTSAVSQTYNPTLGASDDWSVNLVSYKAPTAAAVARVPRSTPYPQLLAH